MSEEKIKLSCPACYSVYWADVAGLPDASAADSTIPYACPQCDHEESKVEE
jgi:hypothetical protein